METDTGLPVVSAGMLADVDELRRLRETGVAHHVDMGGRETGWLVTTYETAAKILVDPRMMGEPPGSWPVRPESGSDPAPVGTELDDLVDEEDLFFLPEDDHTRLRRIITRQFTHRRVTALAPRIQGEVDKLLDAMPRNTPVDFIPAFARPLPVAVLCELLGVPEGGRGYIRDYVYGWIAGSGAATTVTKSAGVAMAEYLRTLIAERRAAPADDLISAMADGAADRDVLSAVRLLLVAGHRPVTRLLFDGLELLLRPRSRWEWLLADPSRLDAAVEELLRVVTPTALSSRYAKDGAELDGEPLARGSGVHCALGAVNRDPERFTDPDTFDPDRSVNPHLAFGLGRKHCLGAALARVEAQLVYGTLLRRFPDIRLAEPTDGRRQVLVVLEPAS